MPNEMAPQASLPRPIFYFHIPKTGGSSVFATLRAAVGPRRALLIWDTRAGAMEARIRRHVASRRTVLFSTHASPASLPVIPGLIRTTVLRHPMQRALSGFCYCFTHRHAMPAQFEFMRQCRDYLDRCFSLADLERWIETFGFDNLQVRFLAGCFGRPVAGGDLERATSALDSCDLVGTTEKLVPYLAALADRAGLRLARFYRTNASPREMIAVAPEFLDARLRRFFELDFMLYEIACKRAEIALVLASQSMPALAPVPVVRDKWSAYERAVNLLRANPRELAFRAKSRLWRVANYWRDRLSQLRSHDATAGIPRAMELREPHTPLIAQRDCDGT